MSREDRLKAAAGALGFTACGVATLEPSRHADALDAWLAAGYGGTMRYLHRQAARRRTPASIVPEARCAVVVLDNYAPPPADPAPGPMVSIARYARGEDYHRVTLARLERLADWLREEGATVAGSYVDAGPVPERELAQRAGLGWIGKNTMLIRPGAGSWCFIGSIFTDLPLVVDSPFETDRCGRCTRCLDACPTGAFVEPRVLDATRCTSYLTIEAKGPMPEELVPQLEGWAFGCDICNEVCPWNIRFSVPTTIEAFHPREVPDRGDPAYFDGMSDGEFERQFGGTPLERPGLRGMRRNWAAAWGSERGAGNREPGTGSRES